MDNLIDGTGSKLGHGFASASGLKEIDIGPIERTRLTYMDAKSNPEYELKLMDLLEEI